MPSGVSAEHAGAGRNGTRVWPRFAAALIVSTLLHAVFTALIAPAPTARTNTAAALPPLAVRLLAPDVPSPAASTDGKDEPPERSPAVRAKPPPSRPLSAARGTTRNERPVDRSALADTADTTYYAARQLDTYPVLAAGLDLPFPADAVAADISGYVLLLVLIDAEGRVNDASVVEAVPAGVFDDGTKRALLAARFKPASRNGRAVRSRLIVHVSYGRRD